jgi:hypothetical protein
VVLIKVISLICPSNLNIKDKWIKEKEIAGKGDIRYGDPSWIIGWVF